jgi:ferrochelatase
MGAQNQGNSDENRSAVVLMNFGGPESLGEVSSFLYEILSDPNTLQFPFPQVLQNVLARKIANRRTSEIQRQYSEIGGKSPIVEATEAIRADVAARLQLKAPCGSPMTIFVAHRYLAGWCGRTAREITAAGVNSLLAVPLYPHFSYATTGSSLEQLRSALLQAGYRGRFQSVRSYPEDGDYLAALAARLEATLAAESPPPEDTVILCSAHGLPEAYVRRGDPYPEELALTVEAMRRRFPQWKFVISYQSRVGPAQWLKPYTDRIVPELAEQGVKHLVFLPLSFVNDHIETLFEIAHTYFELARRSGMQPALVPAVENHPLFIRSLAGQILSWRQDETGAVADELLPRDQHFARVGQWAWGLWLVALGAALWFAISRG